MAFRHHDASKLVAIIRHRTRTYFYGFAVFLPYVEADKQLTHKKIGVPKGNRTPVSGVRGRNLDASGHSRIAKDP